MPRFHPLEVTDIRRETRDAVVLTLRPRAEDAAALSQAWRLAGAKDWAGADAAARASGPVAIDLVTWQRLRAGQGTWAEYRDFAARNADWPGMDLLLARGDAALVELTNRFDRTDLTADGLRFTPAEIDAACAGVAADDRAADVEAATLRTEHATKAALAAEAADRLGECRDELSAAREAVSDRDLEEAEAE